MLTNLIRVVSSGVSAAIDSDRNPQRAPAPAAAIVLRKSRRLKPSRFAILDPSASLRTGFGFLIVGSKPRLIGVILLVMDFSYSHSLCFLPLLSEVQGTLIEIRFCLLSPSLSVASAFSANPKSKIQNGFTLTAPFSALLKTASPYPGR